MVSKELNGISVSLLNKELKKKKWSHYRLAKETGISEASISRIFKSGQASMYHILVIANTLNVSPHYLQGIEEDNETYTQWEKRTRERPTIEQTRFIKAQTALSDYLDNVVITAPDGKQFHIDSALLYQHGGTLESSIKEAITAWMDDNGYFDTGKE